MTLWRQMAQHQCGGVSVGHDHLWYALGKEHQGQPIGQAGHQTWQLNWQIFLRNPQAVDTNGWSVGHGARAQQAPVQFAAHQTFVVFGVRPIGAANTRQIEPAPSFGVQRQQTRTGQKPAHWALAVRQVLRSEHDAIDELHKRVAIGHKAGRVDQYVVAAYRVSQRAGCHPAQIGLVHRDPALQVGCEFAWGTHQGRDLMASSQCESGDMGAQFARSTQDEDSM